MKIAIKHAWALFAVLAVCLSPAAAGQENILALRIDEIKSTATAGAPFDFSFSPGNMLGPPCDARVEYWLGTKDSKMVEGQDVIFLATGETKSMGSFLLVPNETANGTSFYLQMQCNNATALASRPIKISEPIPTAPKIMTLDILKDSSENKFEFNYTLKAYSAVPQPVSIEETIITGDTVIWKSTQNTLLAGTESFTRLGPLLAPGAYKLSIAVNREGETSKASRDFDIEQTGYIAMFSGNFPPALYATILLFSVGVASLFYRFFRSRRSKKPGQGGKAPHTAAPGGSGAITGGGADSGNSLPEPAKNYVCMAESLSSGFLGENELNSLLDDAGFSEEEKKAGAGFAGRVPVSQAVRSGVFIDKFGKPNCETIISVTAGNDSGRDLCNVVFLARLPGFLSENVSSVLADGDLQASKEGSVLKFTIPRMPAGEAVSVSYSIGKWITQEKAQLVPLPAAVNCEESQPIVFTAAKATGAKNKNPAPSACAVKGKKPEKNAKKKDRTRAAF